MRLIELIVLAAQSIDRDLHPSHPCGRRGWFDLDWIKCLGPGHVDNEAEARTVAGCLERVQRLPWNVHQRSPPGDERFLSFDVDSDFTLDDREPLARVGMKSLRRPG